MNGSEIDYFFLFLRDDWFSLLSIHLGGRLERRGEHGCIFFQKPEWVGEVGKDKIRIFVGNLGKEKDF